MKTPKTNHLKTEVRSLLLYGKKNARTGNELAKILGFDNDRLVRQVIRELITEGMPVASVTVNPGGFFIATNKEEINAYALTLRKRLIEDALRRRDFRRAARNILQPGQLSLL